jgi:DNA-directed RNA polymerase specialized sigma24 family protein
VAKKRKPKTKLGANAEPAKEPSLAIEIGRIAKIFALYLLKDIPEEGKKVGTLYAFGYSAREIAGLLGKTEEAVRKAKSRG